MAEIFFINYMATIAAKMEISSVVIQDLVTVKILIIHLLNFFHLTALENLNVYMLNHM